MVNDTADLKERIEQKIKAIKNERLENVFDGIVKSLKFCIDVNGDTFQQKLLVSNKTLKISLSFNKKIVRFGYKMTKIFNFLFGR